MAGVRIILDGDVTAEEVKSALKDVGLTVRRELPATEESPLEILFQDGDGRQVRFTQDPFICVNYLDAADNVLGGTIARLRLILPYYSDDEILRRARADRNAVQERVDWLMSATALEHRADRADLADLIGDRLKDASPAVRMAALRAAGWLGWPEFIPLVQPLAEDSDAEVRSFAADIVNGFERTSPEQ